jgi:PAS domain S-box-containing protein
VILRLLRAKLARLGRAGLVKLPSSRAAAASARELLLDERESTAGARDEVLRLREHGLTDREELARARTEREGLLSDLREANQNLLLAGLRAEQLATEAEDAHRRMTLSEARLRTLVDATALVVWRADPKGAVEFLSAPKWQQVTGLGQGSRWLDAIPAEERAQVEEGWALAREQGERWAQEHRLCLRDGSRAWVESRAVPLKDPEGRLSEWIGMMVDVTAQHRVGEAREQFMGILGHDLRNPLQAILLTSTGLSRDPELPRSVRDRAARIMTVAFRMERMINDLLDFARGRLGGGIPVARERLDLGAHLAHTLEELRLANPDRQLSFEIEGDLHGEWDPDRLEQVVSNLVGNAVAHGEDPIRVRLYGAGDQVRIEVHNPGPAIPARLLPALFEPFRAGSGEGLGLGLYIVAEIVRGHGGAVTVESKAPDGATFRVTLPRWGPQDSVSGAGAEPPAAP